MSEEQYSRTHMLLGEAGMESLRSSRVAVFGIGGVGGHVVDALARSGVGTLDIIDNDTISESNINRQLIATHATVGRPKTEVMREHIRDIDPEITVNEYRCFYLPANRDEFDFTVYDYVVDAVDTVTAKISIIMAAQEANVPVISSMGAGNKLHPEMFELADLYETSICPLARVMRKELKKRGVEQLKVVYSKEQSIETGGRLPGSAAFVPSAAGLIIAGEVIRCLAGISI